MAKLIERPMLMQRDKWFPSRKTAPLVAAVV